MLSTVSTVDLVLLGSVKSSKLPDFGVLHMHLVCRHKLPLAGKASNNYDLKNLESAYSVAGAGI